MACRALALIQRPSVNSRRDALRGCIRRDGQSFGTNGPVDPKFPLMRNVKSVAKRRKSARMKRWGEMVIRG